MKCFVIMPFGNREKDPARKRDLDGLYDHCIKPAVEAVAIPGRANEHVRCHRGDKEPGPGEIITHIIENLVRSELAIADLTGRNPNVFYELGVRHAVSDNTILISESEEDVPFDLRGQRLILFKRDFEGGGRLRTEITKAVEEIVRSPSRIDNPVRRFLFDREQEKMLKKIEEQGRPPGYDFVNQLMQEMANLRKDFRSQLDEVRAVMNAVTAQPAAAAASASADPNADLTFLAGAWINEENDTHLYGRFVHGQLIMAYCYGGDYELTSRYYNFRRIGNHIFARFEWINVPISGYTQLRIESPDFLVGGWWPGNEVPGELANDITRTQNLPPGMTVSNFRRLPDEPFPTWAKKYFAKQERRSA